MRHFSSFITLPSPVPKVGGANASSQRPRGTYLHLDKGASPATAKESKHQGDRGEGAQWESEKWAPGFCLVRGDLGEDIRKQSCFLDLMLPGKRE